jgi:hypothetical protein
MSPLTEAKQQAVRRIRAMVHEGLGACSPIVFPLGMKGMDGQGYPRLTVEGEKVKTYRLVWMAEQRRAADRGRQDRPRVPQSGYELFA